MLNVTSGEATTISVPFLVDGEYAPPDDGSVTYDLLGNDGSPLADNQPVTVDAGATSAIISIIAGFNSKSKDIEYRTLRVRYSVGGSPYIFVKPYRIVQGATFSVTPDAVRSKLGLVYSELPDDDIDIFEAYYELMEKFGTSLTTALVSGTMDSIRANLMILYKTILNTLPSLALRLRSSQAEGTVKETRLSKIDLGELKEFYASELEGLENKIASAVVETPTFIAFSTRTDPVTNA